jgi:copper(I)-binding protein
MRRNLILIASVFAAMMFSTLVHADDIQHGDLRVHDPWARATIGISKTGAAYLTVMNQLIGASTSVAEKATLHRNVVDEDGVMKMRPVEAIEVPAGGDVKLEPGGLHIMLMGVHEPLKAGEHFPLTLTFERAGQVEITVPIADIAASSSDHGVEGHQLHEMDEAQAHEHSQTIEVTDDGTATGAAVAQKAPQRVIEVRIENRKVVAPREAIRVTEGDLIELRWTSDEFVELHLHGYDLELHVRPGEPASMSIEAYATGRFPITSHGWGEGGHSHDALTYLEVHPD